MLLVRSSVLSRCWRFGTVDGGAWSVHYFNSIKILLHFAASLEQSFFICIFSLDLSYAPIPLSLITALSVFLYHFCDLLFFSCPSSSLMSESAGIPLLHSDGRHGKPLPPPFAPGGVGVGKPSVRRWRLHGQHGGAPGHLPVHWQRHPQLVGCSWIPVLHQWLWRFHCFRWIMVFRLSIIWGFAPILH